jgi:radical SAM superfamily enzyme YgiQ (UPF0313 family)
MNVHPKGTKARILLTSVFGPYAQDDEFGSRKINPMELYQNQVTRFQGAFSLRMFHRSFGLMLIQNNIDAPCTLLDFPSMDRFIRELENNDYDIVGISGIVSNVGKIIKMCELVRQALPQATIVIGGHVANMSEIHELADADHVVKGDGVRWFRKYLGQDHDAPVRHPMAYSGIATRTMGITLRDNPGDTAAILVPSVGCPLGCNFCSTSALFGGKGKFINFYETGDALFEVMSGLEKQLKVQSFFILDENFLLHRKRALRLLELMEANFKSWALYVFSSARVLKSYSIEQLIGLGISWVWMGLEGRKSRYQKLNGVDTHALVKTLQSNGIRVLGSSIIGLENHRPEEMDQVIEDAVVHGTDFHQFMLYIPIPGTPLYNEHKAAGTLLDPSEFSWADAHGQYRFNYHHPHITDGMEEKYIRKAFIRDFEMNGPSLARLIRTQLTGWLKYRRHFDQRIRKRFQFENRTLGTSYAGAVWAMRKWCIRDDRLFKKMDALLKDLYRAFGWKAKLSAPLIGRFLWLTLKREEKRLADGWSYEPPTHYERNPAAQAIADATTTAEKYSAGTPKWVTCKPHPV